MAARISGDPQGAACRPAARRHAGRAAAERHRRRSRSCSSPAPRAAATASPGRSRPCTASPTRSGSRCWAGPWTCTGSRGSSCPPPSSPPSAWRCSPSRASDPLPLAYAAVVVAGLFTPPLEGGLRALWPRVLRQEDQVHTAYAHGRGGAGGHVHRRAAAGDPAASSLWSRAGRAAGHQRHRGPRRAVGRASRGPPARWRSAPREAHWLGALRSPGLLALLGSFFFVGIALGSITVAGVAYADDHGGDVGVRLADGRRSGWARWSAAWRTGRGSGPGRPSGGCGCWWRCWRSAICR